MYIILLVLILKKVEYMLFFSDTCFYIDRSDLACLISKICFIKVNAFF